MKPIVLSLVMIINIYAAQNSSPYSWNTFMQKALDASFSLKHDNAQIAFEKGKISQSTLWENPDFEIEFDDRLEDSMTYTYLEVSQKLPAWGANVYKKRGAQAELESAKYAKGMTALQVQYHAASLFFKINFITTQLDILDQQLEQIHYLRKITTAREDVGEISGLERSRIDIMKQQIAMKKQSLKNSYLEAQLEAQSLLNIEGDISLLGTLVKPNKIKVDMLVTSLEQSPKYRLYSSKVSVAKNELSLVKTQRYALPELHLYQERESDVNNQTQSTYGFGIRLSIPLWDRQDSQIEIKKAVIQKNNIKAQEVLYTLQRDVRTYYRLYQNSLQQFQEYKIALLEPSKEFYEVTAYSFELGEKSLLELLDAQTLYFQSQLEYQALISQSNFYWLRLSDAASINLLKDNS